MENIFCDWMNCFVQFNFSERMHEPDKEETNGSALLHTKLLVIPEPLVHTHKHTQCWNRAQCNLECFQGRLKNKNKDTTQS